MTIIIKKYSMKPTAKRQTVTNSQNTIFAIKRFINNILKIAKNLIEKISYIMILLICTSSFATEKNRPNMFGEFNLGVYDGFNFNYTSDDRNLFSDRFFTKSMKLSAGGVLFNDIIMVKFDYQRFDRLDLNYPNHFNSHIVRVGNYGSLDDFEYRKRFIDYNHQISADLRGFNVMLKVLEFNNILTYIGYGFGQSSIQNFKTNEGKVRVERNMLKQVLLESMSTISYQPINNFDDKTLYNKFCFSAKYRINKMLDLNIINYEFIKLGKINYKHKPLDPEKNHVKDFLSKRNIDDIYQANANIHNITSGITIKINSSDAWQTLKFNSRGAWQIFKFTSRNAWHYYLYNMVKYDN